MTKIMRKAALGTIFRGNGQSLRQAMLRVRNIVYGERENFNRL